MRTREPTKLQTRDGTLPESLIEGIEWRGFEEPCREAIIFPVRPTNGESVMAFLLIGVNPRRPYDESYHSFVNMLNRQLATSLASILLFEDEIRRSEAATRENEQLTDQLALQTKRLQRMTEVSTVGLYYIDLSGVLVEANDRYYEITGHSRHDSSERSFLTTVHDDSMHIALLSWQQVTVDQIPWSGELRLRKPCVDPVTGEVLENWIICSAQPEFGIDGSLRSVMGSITDISRIKWAEGLQNQRLQDAEETRRQTNKYVFNRILKILRTLLISLVSWILLLMRCEIL
jgi:PAS domain S-box-containing protein